MLSNQNRKYSLWHNVSFQDFNLRFAASKCFCLQTIIICHMQDKKIKYSLLILFQCAQGANPSFLFFFLFVFETYDRTENRTKPDTDQNTYKITNTGINIQMSVVHAGVCITLFSVKVFSFLLVLLPRSQTFFYFFRYPWAIVFQAFWMPCFFSHLQSSTRNWPYSGKSWILTYESFVHKKSRRKSLGTGFMKWWIQI